MKSKAFWKHSLHFETFKIVCTQIRRVTWNRNIFESTYFHDIFSTAQTLVVMRPVKTSQRLFENNCFSITYVITFVPCIQCRTRHRYVIFGNRSRVEVWWKNTYYTLATAVRVHHMFETKRFELGRNDIGSENTNPSRAKRRNVFPYGSFRTLRNNSGPSMI